MSVISWYTNKLLTKPYTTKMVTSFFTFGLGDVISQFFEINGKKKKREKSSFNVGRFLKQATFGVISTPYLHIHFGRIIPFIVPVSTNPNPRLRVLKSLCYDQTLHASFFMAVYFMWLNLVNNTGLVKAYTNTKEIFVPTMIANWKVWPLAMLVNYSIVPSHYSVLYVNTIAIFWNTYISYIYNRSSQVSEN